MSLKKVGLILIFVILGLVRDNYAVMVMNGVGVPTPITDESNTAKVQSVENNCEQYIVEGAEHFLRGCSYIAMMLAEYEVSERITPNLTFYTDYGYYELQNALYYFRIAKDCIPQQSQEVITTCTSYDYNELRFQNTIAMYDAIDYFKKGDMMGLHIKNIENIENILSSLRKIYVTNAPGKEFFWGIMDEVDYARAFSNYSSRIWSKLFN